LKIDKKGRLKTINVMTSLSKSQLLIQQ